MCKKGKREIIEEDKNNNKTNDLKEAEQTKYQNSLEPKVVLPGSRYNLSEINEFKDNLLFIPRSSENKENEYIPCFFIESKEKTNKYLLMFHGNGESIFDHSDYFGKYFTEQMNFNTICIEYPSYTIYEKELQFETILDDTLIVYDYIKQAFNIEDKNLFIFGRSIGSSPAIYLASKRNPNALILMSGFSCMYALLKVIKKDSDPNLKTIFDSINYIEKVKCPVLLIHGIDDRLIEYNESKILKSKCSNPKSDLKLFEGMDHNYFSLKEHLGKPIQEFLKINCDISIEEIKYDFTQNKDYKKMKEIPENLKKYFS